MNRIVVATVAVVVVLLGGAALLWFSLSGSQPAPTAAQAPAQAKLDQSRLSPGAVSDSSTAARPATPTPAPGAQAQAPRAPEPPRPSDAAPQPAVRSVHGDWEIRCDTPPGATSEQCALTQFVTAADRQNVGLTAIVLKTADKKARILRVLAPLGVLLPSGLGLKVDDADIGRAGFVRCLPNGCIAEVILEDDLLNKLKTGKSAIFIVFQTPEEGIGIPISLAGFGTGFDKLP